MAGGEEDGPREADLLSGRRLGEPMQSDALAPTTLAQTEAREEIRLPLEDRPEGDSPEACGWILPASWTGSMLWASIRSSWHRCPSR